MVFLYLPDEAGCMGMVLEAERSSDRGQSTMASEAASLKGVYPLLTVLSPEIWALLADYRLLVSQSTGRKFGGSRGGYAQGSLPR